MGQPISIQEGSSLVKRLEVNGFRVTSANYPSRLHLPLHYHEVACFAVVLSGVVDKVFPRRSYELPQASLVTMPPLEKHQDQFAVGGATMLVIEPVAVGKELIRPCAHLFDLVYQSRDKVIMALARRIQRELHKPDSVSSLVVNGLIFELLAMAARRHAEIEAKSPPPYWLNKVHDYLHAYFHESFQLADVAQIANVHPVHLSRIFRAYYGRSIGDYVRQLRLDWVTQQLVLSNDSLAYLAQKAGFADQSHFTRTFKQNKGIPPGQYRRVMAR